MRVEKDYRFETADGEKTLAELFDGRSQLVIYHFMFGPGWTGGCPVCSSIADTLAPQVPHLKARDTTLLLASRAAVADLLAYRERMGWPIEWVSTGDSTVQQRPRLLQQRGIACSVPCRPDPGDGRAERAHVRNRPRGYVTEGPGLSVYALDDGTVYRTYVSTARGLEVAMAYYGLLDRTPRGRDEPAGEPSLIRRHNEYSAS